MKLTGDRNQCRGCKEYFNSSAAFDKHRTGQHGVDRRCMTEAEMFGKGMELNAAGYWVGSRMDNATLAKRVGSHDQEAIDAEVANEYENV